VGSSKGLSSASVRSGRRHDIHAILPVFATARSGRVS